ncbi:phage gene 29 protein family protein [Mycolicibacter arupensis]|jgi:hypothetical protein|uniref:Uncharacterized protein n=1 Tax=Mycolicibacter arupensis TaxID=342002 RepID=A0A5C7Y616_9MYCO|nr:hypothetical protein [Mycolicibacter arupensis]TXI57349.1 MAG: hypothetical protein E6Q54_08195 [Mycolicibacter arupensis]
MQPHINIHSQLNLPEIPEPGPNAHPRAKAVGHCRSPGLLSPEATIYDLRFVNIPVIARHLARAGLGPVAGQAVIRPVDAPGGYRQWVDIDAPDP